MNKALRSIPSWLAALISTVVVLLAWELICWLGQVREVIRQHVEGRTFGVLGQPRVNVLLTNRALDARFGRLAAEGG